MKSKDGAKRRDPEVVIWGGGGHGRVVIDLLRASGGWRIAGLVDSRLPADSRMMEVPVLGDEDVLPALLQQGVRHLVVAVGDCAARARMIEKAGALGFDLPVVAHPSAVIYPSASVAPGCVLCAGAVVGAQAQIGRGVIVNTRAVVDHDCIVGEYAHVAPGAVLCGCVTVGRETWIGAGSVARDHIVIGSRVMAGAGSVIVKPVADGRLVCGNPARERESTP